MYRHPFDEISFFFGLLFTAGAASALLVDDAWPFGRGRLWPILLIAGGVALLIASLRPGGNRRPAQVITATTPAPAAEAPADPVLVAAHREVDEYLGEATPTGDAPMGDTDAADTAAADTVAGPYGEPTLDQEARPMESPSAVSDVAAAADESPDEATQTDS